MRDLMSWGVNLPRMFGIPVKVHWTFFVVTAGLFLRQVLDPLNVVWWGDILLLAVIVFFAIVLAHELGHCLAGRLVGGEPQEILMWPLGGLAYVDLPHTPKAHLLTAAGGPAVNLVLALLCGMVLAVAGFTPNPLHEPYKAAVRNQKDGRLYTSDYGLNLYEPGSDRPVAIPPSLVNAFYVQRDQAAVADILAKSEQASPPYQRARASQFVVWTYRVFWLNCLLLAINLLPAYPLDGGQMLLAVIWGRSGDYRRGVTVAAYSGIGVAMLLLVVCLAYNESMLVALAAFMILSAVTRLNAAEAEDSGYGDFSAGYTSLEKDDPPPPRPKVGPVKKWFQARAARRIQRELEATQADDERMDQLLDKIARTGKGSLTAEEKRFLDRQSERYKRNK